MVGGVRGAPGRTSPVPSSWSGGDARPVAVAPGVALGRYAPRRLLNLGVDSGKGNLGVDSGKGRTAEDDIAIAAEAREPSGHAVLLSLIPSIRVAGIDRMPTLVGEAR
jgi:hypothetical protein